MTTAVSPQRAYGFHGVKTAVEQFDESITTLTANAATSWQYANRGSRRALSASRPSGQRTKSLCAERAYKSWAIMGSCNASVSRAAAGGHRWASSPRLLEQWRAPAALLRSLRSMPLSSVMHSHYYHTNEMASKVNDLNLIF
eukprot:6207913-Pleurochrysis_carterae.AAC.3